MKNSRHIAITILQKIIKDGMFFSECKEQLQVDVHKDIAFINMLVLTTLRHRVFIQKTLQKLIKKKSKDSSRFADFAIEVATTELLFLNTPDYAVLNSYIDIIKKQDNKYIANFANAVLRNISRQKNDILLSDKDEFFPNNFKKHILKGYSLKEIQKIEKYARNIPALDISLKDLTQLEEINQKLKGLILPNDSIRIDNSGKVNELFGYSEGLWWVQDFAATLSVLALGDIKGKKVLDLCAAPGGKTAQLISKGAITTALDISENRLNTLQENLQRLKLKAENIICANAVDFLQNYSEQLYDIILLDAPCSATGTFRRHPELLHIKSFKDVDTSVKIQNKLLELSAKALKKDGILIYTVCSIAQKEGEIQIDNFLKNNPKFKLIPITATTICPQNPSSSSQIINKQGCIRTLPYHLGEQGGMDSFFVAKLQKVK